MKNFIDYVAKSLVNTPERLIITEHLDDSGYKIELYVPPDEIGKIIGRHGQMANALRAISSFHAEKVVKKNLTFRIVENQHTH